MKLVVHPGSALSGEVSLPGDKSISHRAALLAALAEGESRIDRFLDAGVTRALLGALADLGVTWRLEGPGELRVAGSGLHGFKPPSRTLDCGNSATTLRLLAGALAASGVAARLDGSPGLRRRPMERILAPLRQMGVEIKAADGGVAPLHILSRMAGGRLRAINYPLPLPSAQVKTCLLLAALAGDGPTRLREPAPSRDHTERLLAGMGARIETARSSEDGGAEVTLYPLDRPLKPLQLEVPGDFSSAAFLIVATAITPNSRVTLRGVGLNPGRTGLLEALAAMGARIEVSGERMSAGEPAGDVTVSHAGLHGTRIGGDLVVRMIDEFPAFSVAAACAEGISEVRGAGELRYKESDRIREICALLSGLGVEATEAADGFTIIGRGRIPGGAEASVAGDHRLAMAAALAGLASRRAVAVRGAEIIQESFPDFITSLQNLGASVRIEGEG
jgi:3-phosphoshikimate 1-carboxyvinyltransferase